MIEQLDKHFVLLFSLGVFSLSPHANHALCFTLGQSWEVQAHQSLASQHPNYTISDPESNKALKPTPIISTKQVGKSHSVQTITSCELIVHWSRAARQLTGICRSLTPTDWHRLVQPVKEMVKSRCDGWALRARWQLARRSSPFPWRKERRSKEGWFHYQPTCRLMLHNSTQPTVVMVATCHVICVSPWMNEDLWDMLPPPGSLHRGCSGSVSSLRAAGDTPTATYFFFFGHCRRCCCSRMCLC